MKRLFFFVPALLFVVLSCFLYFGLGNDPTVLPSVTVGKPVPAFQLPVLGAEEGTELSQEELAGEPYLLNVWATWCAACLVEHPYLYELSQRGVKIVGINYKDDPAAAVKWLEKYKDPYAVSVVDARGRLGFDLGVTGAPETFLVDAEGQILYRHLGVVDENVWESHFASTFSQSSQELAEE